VALGIGARGPFLVRGSPGGRFERISLERQILDEWTRACEELRDAQEEDPQKFGDLKCPPRPEAWLGEEPDAVLPPLHPPISVLRGGADSGEDSDSGPVGPHRPRPTIIEDQVL